MQPEVSSANSVDISNNVYGNSVMSAFELSKGYSKPIWWNPEAVPDEIMRTYNMLQSRRKLSLILNSKSISEPNLKVCDLVKIYQHGKNNNRGECSEAEK